MVELLWRLVLKINARAIFLFTVLVLAVVLVVMFQHSNLRGQDMRLAGHRIPPATAQAIAVSPPAARLPSEIEDPFTSAFLMAWLDLEASRQRERGIADAAAAQLESPAPTPPPALAPEWISVIYQGMIARMDGSRIALVVEVDGGVLHTLELDDRWLGYRVKSVAPKRIVLGADGEREDAELPVGESSRVRKGPS
ncbi:MAG: hypothetical protein HQ523_14805 [Lentisphaerae bacterium]|nr:hypothetical protein [Lentisphaerota bacterium]